MKDHKFDDIHVAAIASVACLLCFSSLHSHKQKKGDCGNGGRGLLPSQDTETSCYSISTYRLTQQGWKRVAHGGLTKWWPMGRGCYLLSSTTQGCPPHLASRLGWLQTLLVVQETWYFWNGASIVAIAPHSASQPGARAQYRAVV